MGIFNRRKTEERAAEFPFVLPTGNYLQPLQGPMQVSTSTALTLPTLYRCVHLIADSIASLPLAAFREGQRVQPAPPILMQPDRQSTRVDLLGSVVLSLLIDGNAYLLVGDRDALGYPRQAVVLATDAVHLSATADGEITYKVGGTTYTSEDVLHIRNLTLPGMARGMSILEYQRRTLGGAMAGEDAAANVFDAGGLPVGVLEVDGEISRDEADQLKTGFVAANGGRNRAPAVLANGITYKPLSFSPRDLELLDSREFSQRAICQLFGVPPHLAGVPSSDSSTYSSVTQDSISFVRYCLRPLLSKIEAAFSTLLPRGQEARFILDDLIRGETLTRFQAYEIGLRSGFLTIDEVRRLEDITGTATTEPEVTP